jgi:hypothetical protein
VVGGVFSFVKVLECYCEQLTSTMKNFDWLLPTNVAQVRAGFERVAQNLGIAKGSCPARVVSDIYETSPISDLGNCFA